MLLSSNTFRAPRPFSGCHGPRGAHAAPTKANALRCRATGEQDMGAHSDVVARRAILLGATAGSLFASRGAFSAEKTSENTPRTGEVQHSEEEWKRILPPSAYRVLRQAGTELPLSSPLYKEKRSGTYKCGGCGTPVFSSQTKYESGTGWPSFTEAVDNSVTELLDYSIPFYPRTEVRCKTCGGHLGHVFPDGPPPTGQRYCMNGAALKFEPALGQA